MQMLDINEIEELLDEIRTRVLIANRSGNLEELLLSMGLSDLMETPALDGDRNGKIVVLGASDVDEQHLLGLAGKMGLDKSRFEFCLDYEAMQKYNFRKLQYSDKYRVVLVGPMPHSTHGTSDSSSAISDMEKHPEMYPRIIRMWNGNTLKITKTGFREVLERLIQDQYI